MKTASVQRVWALGLVLLVWALLLSLGLASIVTRSRPHSIALPLSISLWPEPERPAPITPPRGTIYASDGTPLALSLQSGERAYPMGTLAGQVIGYVKGKRDEESGLINTLHERHAGQAGVERARDRALSKAEDVYLTIDPVLQTIAEDALLRGVEASGAAWGTAIVMESATGRLLAVANAPAFDPEAPRGAPGEDPRLVNNAFERLIEPGSTLKPLTAAVLLEEGAASLDEQVDTPMRRRVADRVIRDVVQHPGRMSLEEVLAYSSNVGISTFVERLDAKTLTAYHEKMHLYDPDLMPGFSVWRPLYRDADEVGEVELANLSFGQGLSVTPIHLAAAFNTLANDGVYVRPTLLQDAGSQEGERVFRAEVARQLRDALVRHNASRARVKGYALGGKTGTAQIARNGSYRDSEIYAALYAGFLSGDHPRATVLVVLYDPQTSIYGSKVAAPVFREIAARSLAYWGLPPETAYANRGE